MGFNDDGWADSPNIKQNLEKRFSQTIDKSVENGESSEEDPQQGEKTLTIFEIEALGA